MRSKAAIEADINTRVNEFLITHKANVSTHANQEKPIIGPAIKLLIKIAFEAGGCASLSPHEIESIRKLHDYAADVLSSSVYKDFDSNLLPLFDALAEHKPTLRYAVEMFGKQFGDRFKEIFTQSDCPIPAAHILSDTFETLDLLCNKKDFFSDVSKSRKTYANDYRVVVDKIRKSDALERVFDVLEKLKDDMRQAATTLKEDGFAGSAETLEQAQIFCTNTLSPAVENERVQIQRTEMRHRA
jgi:hypothetical protein